MFSGADRTRIMRRSARVSPLFSLACIGTLRQGREQVILLVSSPTSRCHTTIPTAMSHRRQQLHSTLTGLIEGDAQDRKYVSGKLRDRQSCGPLT